jgi:hypothetical protein
MSFGQHPPGRTITRKRHAAQGTGTPPQSHLSAAHYHLSVSGVHPTDEQAFDKAYAATDFRHAAVDILREVGPRVGSKRDAGTAAAAAAMSVLPLHKPLYVHELNLCM